MRFETDTFQKIRFLRVLGPDGLRTAWHTGLGLAIDKARELGIRYKDNLGTPIVSAILKNDTDLYFYHGVAGTAEIGGKKFIMLEKMDDYLVIGGKVYIRTYDEFSIDPEEEDRDDGHGSSAKEG